jgi:hypothetical protein
MIPTWLHTLSLLSLALGVVLALAVVVDELRRPQMMWIMNVVWPVTVLYGTVFGLWLYLRFGRASAPMAKMGAAHPAGHHHAEKPFAARVAISTAHCGSGCTVGDLIAEWLAFFVPAIALWFGYQSLFGEKMFAVWILDYIFAFVVGIMFQYFAIKPMGNLTAGQALVAALKADSISLTAWQIGMYGFMAIAAFAIWRPLFGLRLQVDSVEFWFMMQLAMLCGFLTSYPANWWLVRIGIKEAM